jgi:ATP-binding cassette subfamily B protein
VNVKELDIKSYYKIWGCLFQSFAKLWFSPRENIGIGNIEDIDNLKLVKDAATKSGANDFIEKLKNGYETFLTTSLKGGTDLSGGQWQKIGIARSIFANPKFIVLDEPTSALDALAEIEVFKQIESLSNEATMVIVSHRFATVRQANRILVLEDGAILEQGTHEELMANKAMYHEMFTAQALGYK